MSRLLALAESARALALLQRSYSATARDAMAKNGQAMSDGSFPITTRADLENAIKAYGRSANKSAAKRHIIKRAKALKATDLLPESWGVAVAQQFAILQADGAHRVVTGVIQSPDTETLSRNGDQFFRITYPRDVIRDAAWAFVEDGNLGALGVMHEEVDTSVVPNVLNDPAGKYGRFVESYIAPCDLTIGETAVPAGAWVASARVTDDGTWERVDAGELAAFSLTTLDYELEPVEEGSNAQE